MKLTNGICTVETVFRPSFSQGAGRRELRGDVAERSCFPGTSVISPCARYNQSRPILPSRNIDYRVNANGTALGRTPLTEDGERRAEL